MRGDFGCSPINHLGAWSRILCSTHTVQLSRSLDLPLCMCSVTPTRAWRKCNRKMISSCGASLHIYQSPSCDTYRGCKPDMKHVPIMKQRSVSPRSQFGTPCFITGSLPYKHKQTQACPLKIIQCSIGRSRNMALTKAAEHT